MISLLTMIIGLVAIAVFGRAVAEAFGHGSKNNTLNPGEHQQRELPDAPSERFVTEAPGTRSSGGQAHVPPRAMPRATVEQRLAELKRQYVADEITVEQYEAELDKLLRGE